jgi:hypothetical protein
MNFADEAAAYNRDVWHSFKNTGFLLTLNQQYQKSEPFAKKHFVDHTQYETVSILSLIEKRWGIKPLSTRDANANPFTNALEF